MATKKPKPKAAEKRVPVGERSSLGTHLIVNDLAPVRAYLSREEEKTRDFPNLAAFKAWYVPKAHGLIGPPSSRMEFTDVCLESLEDVKTERQLRSGAETVKAEKRRAGAASFGSGSVAVLVEGTRYGTIKGALAKLGIPDGERRALRKTLIEKGEAALTYGKKTYTFKRED